MHAEHLGMSMSLDKHLCPNRYGYRLPDLDRAPSTALHRQAAADINDLLASLHTCKQPTIPFPEPRFFKTAITRLIFLCTP